MSIINRSDYLELSVIKIFEDYYETGGPFFVISPWINNFPFTETILTKNQARIFGVSPNLYDIINVVSNKHVDTDINIINHNYGVKSGRNHEHILKKIEDNIDIYTYDKSKQNIIELYNLYMDLYRNRRDYSKFNDPWITYLPRRFDDYISSLNSKEKYMDSITKIISSINRIKSNLGYLKSYHKLISIDNMNFHLHNNFHAKIFMAGNSCITGSSNWTFSGFHKNDEINLFFSSFSSYDGLNKIKERCYELKKESNLINKKDLENNIIINTVLGKIFEILFEWITDDKPMISNRWK